MLTDGVMQSPQSQPGLADPLDKNSLIPNSFSLLPEQV